MDLVVLAIGMLAFGVAVLLLGEWLLWDRPLERRERAAFRSSEDEAHGSPDVRGRRRS